ncbi:MAG: type II toxin-antitoxin system RelE family toxin [Burkholderiales bacterium]
MAWRVEFVRKAKRELDKLDRPTKERIVRFLRERIATDENPRRTGEALSGEKAIFWKYRVGDYRLICDIQDKQIIVLVIAIGHRREVYR